MVTSYQNTQDEGLITIKSMGGNGARSRHIINSSVNSIAKQNLKIPQNSLNISKSLNHNNFSDQKTKKVVSRTQFKQNQNSIHEQPLYISSMNVQSSTKIDGSSQMSLNQPSIEQMNRDRVNGMITKAHDLQFKMEQISEINNTRGPKPPMQ